MADTNKKGWIGKYAGSAVERAKGIRTAKALLYFSATLAVIDVAAILSGRLDSFFRVSDKFDLIYINGLFVLIWAGLIVLGIWAQTEIKLLQILDEKTKE